MDYKATEGEAMTDQQRDERTVGTLQHIDDVCRRQGVNPEPLMPAVEQVVKEMRPLREAAEKAGFNSRERKVVGEVVADILREGMR